MFVKRIFTGAVLGLALCISVQAQEALTLDELLDLVEQGAVRDNAEMRGREEQFAQARGEQQRLLNEAKAERDAEERRSQRLENSYTANEQRITALIATRDVRLGSLKELFGVTQQVAGDARSNFEASVSNVQFPERSEFLTSLVGKAGFRNRVAVD